jgi:hypothetical protein
VHLFDLTVSISVFCVESRVSNQNISNV